MYLGFRVLLPGSYGAIREINPTSKGKKMRYKVRVAGKVFQGSDAKTLLRLAVEARKAAGKLQVTSSSAPSALLQDTRSAA